MDLEHKIVRFVHGRVDVFIVKTTTVLQLHFLKNKVSCMVNLLIH
jgi:hypothetical protein